MSEEQTVDQEATAEQAPADAPVSDDPAAQLEAERARSAELLDSWQRARAEFLNYKRRVEQEKQRDAQMAGLIVIAKVLPVLDDFDLALANVPKGAEAEAWLNGIALVAHKLRNVLESEGVQPIAATGQKFDPAVHEAVLVDGDGGDFVVAELRRGYTLHGNVIRPALVKVGSGK
ncbi:MAG: nucleotide exchange factor GrpE [Thermomicrobia bacterium]|nr:nucleotide exchange factor GrpE [Thermomicrobia bacterium]MCA1724927.1 nucleotide exchange factor GrpE [Thermomicrobia bacterium]